MLERSDHDNTAVTRWVPREHGVVLAGADPKDLIGLATAAELRREVPHGLLVCQVATMLTRCGARTMTLRTTLSSRAALTFSLAIA